MNWPRNFKKKPLLNEPLKAHTTFKVGGRVKYFFQPQDAGELKDIILYLKKARLPVFLLGAGSNILAADKQKIKAVVHLSGADFCKIEFARHGLLVGAGVPLAKLTKFCENHGLGGMEFLAGVPGTVGGALAMNASAWGNCIGDLVAKVKVMDYNGRVKTLGRRKIKFGYRQSSLSNYIILGVYLKSLPRRRLEITKDKIKFLAQRRQNQDLSRPSAGCVFKNSNGLSSGKLIDSCGLKGKRSGAAMISSRHANFIVNLGNAKAKDILLLMHLAQKEVKKRFKVRLEPEIKIWQ